MSKLAIQHLRMDEVDKAFVLASLGYRNLTIEDWRTMAEAKVAKAPRPVGILFAQDEEHRPRGLLIYGIASGATGKPSLRVERLVAFDLMDPQPVADALVEKAILVARLRDCESISLEAPLDAPGDASALILASPMSVLHRVF